jgi:23S rRNA pseudouridine1911/1915/1917 synthase
MNNISKQIIFEDNHLLIVNKLPKQLVQGDKTGDFSLLELLKDYIKVSANKPGNVFLGLTHRLDRPCSGVVVYAKTSKSLARMNEIFRLKQVSKSYLAWTEQAPLQENASLTHFLKKNEKQNKTYITDSSTPGAKEALLNYQILERGNKYTLLKIELITGRHHQIRAQLAFEGCIIKGDLKYGAARSNKDGSIHLHAHQIEFIHPVKKELLSISATPPKDDTLWGIVEKNHRICNNKSSVIIENEAGCCEIRGI